MKNIGTFLFSFGFLLINCKSSNTKSVSARDTTINAKTTYNNLFLDSTTLEHFIGAQDSLQKYRSALFDFYNQRNYEFAWFDADGMTEQAHSFYHLQNNFAANLNDSSLYNLQLQQLYEWFLINHTTRNKQYDSLCQKAEMVFTGQFFQYALKVYHGSNINVKELGWFIPRKRINTTTLLDSLVDGIPKPLSEYEPLNKQYRLLERFVAKYYIIQKKTSWENISDNIKYKKGDSSVVITAIKKRLAAFGDIQTEDTTAFFDIELTNALKKFQQRMGLKSNGKLDANTIESLNIPIENLIQKMRINMERARWMPYDTAKEDRVVVNIPEFRLNVYDSGKYSFSMPVVVGTAAHGTVIFNDKIRYIVFSPYWNVPTDIIEKEVLPAMKRNSNYLARNNMEIVSYSNGIPEVRQKPGLNNSLGGVKFLFPNKYAIYLHDTPGKDAFESLNRPFSHGCIRVGDPKRLAAFLLRRTPVYTADSIEAFMTLPKEKWMDVKPTVQVIIKYFTAWVDPFGQLNFRKDIYGHDKRMAEKLFDQ